MGAPQLVMTPLRSEFADALVRVVRALPRVNQAMLEAKRMAVIRPRRVAVMGCDWCDSCEWALGFGLYRQRIPWRGAG